MLHCLVEDLTLVNRTFRALNKEFQFDLFIRN